MTDDAGSAAAEEMGEFFNRRAAIYESHMFESGFDAATYQEAVRPLPQTDRPVKVLDLGCGTGLELQYLLARLPNAEVTCIDLSEQLLAILKQHFQDRLEQIEMIHDSYLTWKYPSTAYDAVIAVNTMHHLTRERKVELYRKIRSSLKPGGRYVEADYIVDQAVMEQYQARYRRLLAAAPARPDGYYHIDIPMTVALQQEILLEAGFAEVELFAANVQPKGSRAVLLAY